MSYCAASVENQRIQCGQSRLTNDHEGEKVSVEEVPQDWLVPRFHTDHSGDQVNEGDGLKGDETTDDHGIRMLRIRWCVFTQQLRSFTPCGNKMTWYSCSITKLLV